MKIAIVTGASSGMGRQFVLQLTDYVKVDEIWVIARRCDALEALKQETACPIRTIPMDLCQEDSFRRYAQLLEEAQPDVRLLVNAAGFGKFGAFERISPEEELRMIDLNCKALVRMTRLTLPYMHSGSHILQLDSLSAFQPVPYITTYGATKAFVLSYTRAMNRELKSRNIRMMALNPFWVRTEFFGRAMDSNRGEVQHFSHIYEAPFVVRTGLHDLYETKKEVCVPGLFAKLQVLAVKLLPHRWVMSIWMNQQKTPKNNDQV